MNREEYEKAKAADLKANKIVIDRVPPNAEVPEMFIEKITRFEITMDKLWKYPDGKKLVTFGGGTIMMMPSFSQMLSEAGGIMLKDPIVQKVMSYHEIPMPSGIIKKNLYCSRVVGKIDYNKTTDSGAKHFGFYASEIDIDNLFARQNVNDLELIGSTKNGRPVTEAGTLYNTGNEYKDSVAAYKEKIRLGQHAYQTLITRLRSHGVEKALGMDHLKVANVGGVIYIQRVTPDASNPTVRKMLLVSAANDMTGGSIQRLIPGPQESSVVSEPETINVTENDIPVTQPVEPEEELDVDDIPSDDLDEDVPLWHGEEEQPADGGPLKTAVISWQASESVKNQICADFIDATIDSNESEEFYKAEIEAIKLLADGHEDDGIVAMADSVRFTKTYAGFNETQSNFVKESVRIKKIVNCSAILQNITVLVKGKK